MNPGESNTSATAVFLVHGRDATARMAVVELLEAFDLQVVTWDQAAEETGEATPYTGDVVAAGMGLADAVVVLLSPDDVGSVKEQFREERDGPAEINPTGQARQNVIFEAGMAMALNKSRVVLVEIGLVRPLSDTAGLNMVRLEDTTPSRARLGRRLKTAGLAVNLDSDRWAAAGDISGAIAAIEKSVSAISSIAPGATGSDEPHAVDQLKTYLSDPTKRIQLVDLVENATKKVVDGIERQPLYIQDFDASKYSEVLAELTELSEPLLELIIAGTRHDRGNEHLDMWIASLRTLMQARKAPPSGVSYNELLDRARHFPALLVMRAAGISATSQNNPELLLALLKQPKWKEWYGRESRVPAHDALHNHRVLESDLINQLPQWSNRWLYPLSHFLRVQLRDRFEELLPDEDDYRWESDRYEYRLSIVQHASAEDIGFFRSSPGEFLLRRRWQADGMLEVETDFLEEIEQASSSPWWQELRNREAAKSTLSDLHRDLETMRRDY